MIHLTQKPEVPGLPVALCGITAAQCGSDTCEDRNRHARVLELLLSPDLCPGCRAKYDRDILLGSSSRLVERVLSVSAGDLNYDFGLKKLSAEELAEALLIEKRTTGLAKIRREIRSRKGGKQT